MNPGIEKQFSYFMYILIFQCINRINFKIFRAIIVLSVKLLFLCSLKPIKAYNNVRHCNKSKSYHR
jgi:hypothetical protein